MKSKIYTAILLLIFIIGLALLLYPTVSDYWNSFTSSRAITHYSDEDAVAARKQAEDQLASTGNEEEK